MTFTTMFGGDVEIPRDGYYFVEEVMPNGETTTTAFADGVRVLDTGLIEGKNE